MRGTKCIIDEYIEERIELLDYWLSGHFLGRRLLQFALEIPDVLKNQYLTNFQSLNCLFCFVTKDVVNKGGLKPVAPQDLSMLL